MTNKPIFKHLKILYTVFWIIISLLIGYFLLVFLTKIRSKFIPCKLLSYLFYTFFFILVMFNLRFWYIITQNMCQFDIYMYFADFMIKMKEYRKLAFFSESIATSCGALKDPKCFLWFSPNQLTFKIWRTRRVFFSHEIHNSI